MNVVLVVGVLVVIRFSEYQNFSVSQPIVIKLRLLNVDNIPDFRTVSDFLKLKLVNSIKRKMDR